MDIDIDFVNRTEVLKLFKHIKASRTEKDKLVPHNTGVYFQPIPHDPLTNYSTIDYKEAEKRGYFKIDFLNVYIYKDVKSEEHLNELLTQEPVWELLQDKETVNQLFQLSDYFDLLQTMKPNNIHQLAAIIALIRPGKKHLIGKPWNDIMKEIWIKNDNEYEFKKSHSYAYASAIIVQLNLIAEQILAMAN